MAVIEALTAIVGEGGVLDATEVARRSAGALRRDTLQAQAPVRPKTTGEVARVLRWCHDHPGKIF